MEWRYQIWKENFFLYQLALREKCPYSEFFWSVFSRIWTEYEFSPDERRYGPEKLRIQLLIA